MGTGARGARTTPILKAPLKGVRPVARPHTRRTPILRSGPQRAQFQVARDMLENRPKCCSGVVLIALLLLLLAPCHGKAVAAANNYAPALLDYDTILKLHKLLIEPLGGEEDLMKDRATLLNSEVLINHELVRKSTPNRTPSLRLRFGRRSESPMGVTINEQLEMPVGHYN